MEFLKRRGAIPIVIVGAIALSFPVWFRLINPNYFSDVRCVGRLPDGTVVRAAGSDCTDADRFDTVVILTEKEDGTIEITGDSSMEFSPDSAGSEDSNLSDDR
ncbi:MAG: hypothetical protein AAF327_17480 [Cyanobacteria bacterium P01_A01_bin.37]